MSFYQTFLLKELQRNEYEEFFHPYVMLHVIFVHLYTLDSLLQMPYNTLTPQTGTGKETLIWSCSPMAGPRMTGTCLRAHK